MDRREATITQEVGTKPYIGITGPDEGGFAAWLCASLSVRWQGGVPVRITPSTYNPTLQIDGLILGGGADVAPIHYGETPAPSSGHTPFRVRDLLVGPLLWALRVLTSRWWKEPKDATSRDELEMRLAKKMLNDKRPLLGICRGAQLLNVTLGGTLHQDLQDFYQERPAVRSILPRRNIVLEPHSRLEQIFQRRSFPVNALHRQAVAELGQGVEISARDENGIVQAIEIAHQPFAIGLQWHPEYLPQSRRQRRVFRSLIEAASTGL